jgi:hypothetical protein
MASDTQLDKIRNMHDRSERTFWPSDQHRVLPATEPVPAARERAAIEPASKRHVANGFRGSTRIWLHYRSRSPEPCAQVRILLGAQLEGIFSKFLSVVGHESLK